MAISAFTQLILCMVGALLTNIVVTKVEEYCSYGKELITVKKNSQTNILSMFGGILVTRDVLHCRRCHRGYGLIDKIIEINGKPNLNTDYIE